LNQTLNLREGGNHAPLVADATKKVGRLKVNGSCQSWALH